MNMASQNTTGVDTNNADNADQPAVLLEHVSFQYATTEDDEDEPQSISTLPTAIDDISFSLPKGQLLLIAGPSGCGKSTLLKCLNGLIPHIYPGNLRGTIRLNTQHVVDLSLKELATHIGTMLQDPDKQIVGSTVEQEIAFGLENLGIPRPEMRRRIQAVLRQLKIEKLRTTATHTLSGGQRQLIAAAGLLVMEPSIFLFDEPFASLDSYAVDELEELIANLRASGHTIIIVEHRVEEALRLQPEQVLLLHEGRQVYFGDVTNFLALADPNQVKLPIAATLNQLPIDITPEQVRARLITPIVTHHTSERDNEKSSQTDQDEFILSLKDIHYRYSTFAPEILRGISFQVRRGETIAVLGPNGAGKTTLVKHALGLLRPTKGSMELYGQDSKQLSIAQIASQVGYVFQHPGAMLYAPTVQKEVRFGPENLKFSAERTEQAVERALNAVNVQELADRSPFSLSFGQQKRVTIASVLSMQSRILLLDEPTAGQDYRSYITFMEHIRQIPDLDALLFITHDLDLALRFTQRVLLIKDGTLVADGDPLTILRDRRLLEECHLRPTSLLEYLVS